MKNILFITHAGPDIGGGHLSRCSALARAFERLGASVSWRLNDAARGAAEAFGASPAEFVPNPFAEPPRGTNADLIVTDTYRAGVGYFAALAGGNAGRLLAIADGPGTPAERFASFLIDYSLGAEDKPYAAGGPSLLLGPKYALIRSDFWDLSPSEGDYALLIPGAADVAGAARAAAAGWGVDLPPLRVVIGPLVPEDEARAIKEAAQDKPNVRLFRAPSDLPAMMARAGWVICTASVTMYEALSMKKRTAVFVVADNQLGGGEWLAARGAALDLGVWCDSSPDRLGEIFSFEPDARALGDLVNPRGALRCADEILASL